MKLKKACEAYKDYFAENNIRDTECTLIYLDDDNIPECIYGGYDIKLLRYVNDEVISKEFLTGGENVFSYKEKEGKYKVLCRASRYSGYYLGNLNTAQEEKGGIAYSEGYESVEKCEINGKSVSEDEYNKYIDSLDGYADVSLDYNSIEEAYEALVN